MLIFLRTSLSLLQICSSVSGYQVRRTGTTAIYSNTSSSVSSSSVVCTACEIGVPQNNILEYHWPLVHWSSTEVATVVYQVNTILDITVTTTEYAELTGVGAGGTLSLANNDASFWNSLLETTGVLVTDGTPALTIKPTVYTDPGAFITVTAVVVSPTGYYNVGFLAYLITSTSNPSPLAATDSCDAAPASTFGVTPTAILPGYNDPYQVPLDDLAWSALIPQSLSSCTRGPTFAAISALEVVSALTATTTIYDNNVHPSNTSPTPQNPAASPGTSPQSLQAPTAASSSKSTTSQAPAHQSVGQTSTIGSPPASPLPTTAQPANPTNTVSAPTSTSSPPVVVNYQTVSPGAPAVTISGITPSLAPSSSPLVVGTKTYTPGTSPSTIALGGLTVTPAGVTTPAAPVVVNGNTLSAGASAITVSGTLISLAPSSSLIVVGTKTYVPGTGSSAIVIGSSTIAVVGTETTPATSAGLGSLIWSGIGGSMTASSSSTASVATYTGAAHALHVPAPYSFLSWLACWVVGCMS